MDNTVIADGQVSEKALSWQDIPVRNREEYADVRRRQAQAEADCRAILATDPHWTIGRAAQQKASALCTAADFYQRQVWQATGEKLPRTYPETLGLNADGTDPQTGLAPNGLTLDENREAVAEMTVDNTKIYRRGECSDGTFVIYECSRLHPDGSINLQYVGQLGLTGTTIEDFQSIQRHVVEAFEHPARPVKDFRYPPVVRGQEGRS